MCADLRFRSPKVQVGLSLYATWRVPTPLPSHASQRSFSEGRALLHVKALTDFGIRLVRKFCVSRCAASCVSLLLAMLSAIVKTNLI